MENKQKISPYKNIDIKTKTTPKKKVHFDELVTYNYPSDKIALDNILSNHSENSEDLEDSEDSDSITESNPRPHNASSDSPSWDTAFKFPLTSDIDRKKYIKKIHSDHKKYLNSMGKFSSYLTDNSTLIKTDVTITPFDTKNKTIKEIYDQQTCGPTPIKKKILSKNGYLTTYEDEPEINGGKIKGLNVYGYDGNNNSYGSI